MAKFLEHLDQHTRDLFQSTKEVLDENLPIIYNSLATVKSFISLLGNIILKIPVKLLANLFFIMHIPKENVYKNLLCMYCTVENLYKNSAVDLVLHLIDS